MKKILLLLALSATIYSCTKETNDMVSNLETDDMVAALGYTGEWELVEMTGSAVGSVYTGSDMQWQETYDINEDESFVKTRVRGDSTVIASGTYTITEEESMDESESDIQSRIEFLHNTDNKIIGNCHSNSTIEYLYFTSNNKLISTWNACDGPGLEYVKSK
jgi:hypothetical protein